MRIYCDEHGNLDPDGDYEKSQAGTLLLRDGRRAIFPVRLMDAAATGINFTDAERAFADSGEGMAHIARARMIHNMGAGYASRGDAPFTPTMEAAVVRKALADQASAAATLSILDSEAERARGAAVAARQLYIENLCQAHRS